MKNNFNLSAIKFFIKSIAVASLIAFIGRFFLAGHHALIGWTLIITGDYRIGSAIIGSVLFSHVRLNDIRSRARRFCNDVKEKADQIEQTQQAEQ